MQLRELNSLPEGLLNCAAAELQDFLGAPTLIHLRGACEPALFVSVLLHGNEESGWDGVRRLLRECRRLPRSLSLFIGNVAAAAAGLRVLPDQQDYNRVWRNGSGGEGSLARAVIAALQRRELFAAVDLHNNTGHNPYYSVLTELSAENLGLAYMFSDKAVLLEEPDTVIARAFSDRCATIALELGPVADPACVDRAQDFLHRTLALETVPSAGMGELELFRTRVRVHVKDGIDFAFVDEERPAPLVLTAGVEGVNFHELPAGTRFGRTELPLRQVLQVLDEAHVDATDRYLQMDGDNILIRQSIVPAMYTTDPYVIRQDCLCYFMERLVSVPGMS